MTLRFQYAALPAACFLATSAMAEITSSDVWDNYVAFIDAFGGTVTADSKTTGNLTELTGIRAEFALPMGMGNATLIQSGLLLREAGDGSVELTYPDDLSYRLKAEITGEGAFAATLSFTHSGMRAIATGAPGDIRYEHEAETLTGVLTDWSVPPELLDLPVELNVETVLKGFSGWSTLKAGELVELTGAYRYGEQTVSSVMTAPDGSSNRSDSQVTGLAYEVDFALPADGSDIMNLAAAIKAGLRAHLRSESNGYSASQTQSVEGGPVMEMASGYAESTSQVTLNRDGLSGDGSGSDFFTSFLIPELLPIPVQLGGKQVTMSMAVPLEASETPQPVAMAMKMQDVTLSDDLWSLFDPGQALPRDPAQIELDLSGTMRNLVDLLDVNGLMALAGGGGVPVEAHSADIKSLVIEAVGARIAATGAVTFDNDDLLSYGGMPKPVGAVDVTISGANGLLDTLVSMGLLSDQDAGGARMGMAMVAKPDPAAGEDVLTSRFEFTEAGGVLANGMQLK